MTVSREQREAFTDYILNFVNIADEGFREDGLCTDIAIIKCYQALIDSGIKTSQEITEDLLREYSVLIPYNFILELKKWYKII